MKKNKTYLPFVTRVLLSFVTTLEVVAILQCSITKPGLVQNISKDNYYERIREKGIIN